MPSRDIHRPVGMVAGGVHAGARAYGQYADRPDCAVPIAAAALGGVAGGWLGGALPDWIDPPTSPNHRSYGHGVATVVGVIVLTADWLIGVQKKLRDTADKLKADRWILQNDLERSLSTAAEYFLRFLAGLIDGIIAGYASHLALDATTSSGLPVFARGT